MCVRKATKQQVENFIQGADDCPLGQVLRSYLTYKSVTKYHEIQRSQATGSIKISKKILSFKIKIKKIQKNGIKLKYKIIEFEF